MNQTIDKIIFPYLMPDRIEADEQLGIYGACFKVAMVMMVFTQAFRYAYEPFVFSQNKGEDKKKEYADAMKFFIIFSLLIILGMICFLDVLKYLIRSDYWEGLRVVPIILFSYLFQGIFFNLSLWYKLIDKTKFGAVFSMIGLLITLSINILFVPSHGYIASAMASFCCYLIIMLISYFIGQKYYKIDYDLKSLFLYLTIALLLLAVQYFSPLEGVWKYVQNVLIIALYVVIVLKRDLPVQSLPVVGRFFR
jgi:O-antigen/teichoic acid export membrane protein